MSYRKCAAIILASRAKVKAVISIYKTPWPGDPRVNIQNFKGNAKSYQVRQVLLAIEKLEMIREV